MYTNTYFSIALILLISSAISLNVFRTKNVKTSLNSVLFQSRTATAEDIQDLVYTYPVMVFSKSYCPYSKKAKDILSKYNLGTNYHVLELDQFSQLKMNEYQDELEKLTGARTVPRVFIGGKCIGGADKVEALDKTGELWRHLSYANAFAW